MPPRRDRILLLHFVLPTLKGASGFWVSGLRLRSWPQPKVSSSQMPGTSFRKLGRWYLTCPATGAYSTYSIIRPTAVSLTPPPTRVRALLPCRFSLPRKRWNGALKTLSGASWCGSTWCSGAWRCSLCSFKTYRTTSPRSCRGSTS